MPRSPAPPKPPLIERLFAALQWAGYELSRDDTGYIACPPLGGNPFYRVRLDGDEAVLLLRLCFAAWCNRGLPEGEPMRPVSIPTGHQADAMRMLRALAACRPQMPHRRRVAPIDGGVVIDLGLWRDWRCISVTAQRWRLHRRPPANAYLVRGNGQLPLPQPRRPRDKVEVINQLHQLWPGIRGDRLAVLLAALAWSLISQRDHVVILLHGRAGVGKSALARLIRDLLDPHQLPYSGMPTHDVVRNLLVTGLHERLLALDNVSQLEREVTDALCQRADGYAGARFRALQTNADLVVMPSSGPVLISAIAPVLGQADLADRAVVIDLDEMPRDDVDRLTPAAFEDRVRTLLPQLFGLLLDAARAGLAGAARFGRVEGWRNTAMATFAQAAATALGEPPAAMAEALASMGSYQRRVVASMAPVATAVLDLAARAEAQEGELLPAGMVWRGSITALLDQLAKSPAARLDPGFPHNGAQLTAELLRLRPVLDSNGVRVAFRRAGRKERSPAGLSRWVELWAARSAPAAGGDSDGFGEVPAALH